MEKYDGKLSVDILKIDNFNIILFNYLIEDCDQIGLHIYCMKLICSIFSQRYLDEADKEKEQYTKDLEAYQKTDSYKTFRMQLDKKSKGIIFICIKNKAMITIKWKNFLIEKRDLTYLSEFLPYFLKKFKKKIF